MTEIKQKLICLLEKHKWPLLYAVVTILSMAAWFTLRGMISGDLEIFLLSWVRVLKEEGGIQALKTQVWNYGVLYQTVIALIASLLIQFEYSYRNIFLGEEVFSCCLPVVLNITRILKLFSRANAE